MRRGRRATAAGAVLAVLAIGAGLVAVPAGAAAKSPCATFDGAATFSPALPPAGSVKVVRSRIAINRAKLGGCRGSVASGTASGTLTLARATNCTLLITNIASNVATKAKGTLTITWNTHATSTIALTVSFGSLRGEPSLATMTGTVTNGLFEGRQESWTVAWAMKTTECFGGAPLSWLSFTEFAAPTAR